MCKSSCSCATVSRVAPPRLSLLTCLLDDAYSDAAVPLLLFLAVVLDVISTDGDSEKIVCGATSFLPRSYTVCDWATYVQIG